MGTPTPRTEPTVLGAHRVSLSDELADAFKAIDSLEDRLDFTTNADELGEAVCEIVALRNKVDAAMARVADCARRNGVPQANGQRTIGQFVAARTNTPSMAINRATLLAKWLSDYPLLDAAYGRTMHADHLHYLRKLDTTYERHCHLINDQQIFADAAADCSFTDFVTACEYWVGRVDPDGKEPKDQIASTHLRIRKGTGGRGLLDGECDVLTRQALSTAIGHEAEKIRIADKAAGIVRTDGQRQMAALTNLVARGFAREDGSFPAPLINIVMSLNVAEWATAALANGGAEPGDTVPVDAFDIDGRCELIDGTPIHPFLALFAFNNIGANFFGAPNLRRYVMDAESRPLDVSVNSRYFPEWMRTTALVESRGRCATHGCDARHEWLQTDHVQPVAHGGETRVGNHQPQCWPDNQAKGATPGLTAWRDRPPPPRHHRLGGVRKMPADGDDPDSDDPDHA